ncbi:hypothetical protein PCC8801_0689 [Rippkaea orientalis PCC 8801]|uniref:Uncharacterized protein n=1 Tax=Rippkaea orientalis (strain PCC 8801 / RF-1) TaxID=41431 RepID=B7JXL7_RIPO1|nr:hypothetical protein [Rippkaea orientalis]ACK64774.1 hypothetical protein PCC8801_0689 [Rippkaea orientalis PCC 8801]
MDKHRELETRIAQIKASGEIAPPNTWITSFNVNKNGKKYTYYRLMKADPSKSNGKVRGKMVKYLGTKDSKAYKAMKQAIQRRNQVQVLLRQLQALEPVSGGKQAKQPPLTRVVLQLMTQVQHLSNQLAEIQQWIESSNQQNYQSFVYT